ncbi:MAG: DUF1549 domain-containing protein, partial [Planctomycetota bacterium]
MNRPAGYRRTILVAVWAILGSSARGREISFETSVAPIFNARCVACHNDQTPAGGLSLTNRRSLLNGGDSGAAIMAGRPDDSLLLDYVRGDDPEMPQDGEPLTPAEIAIVDAWITAGAPWPEGVQLEVEETWWSRRPLTRPPVPQIPRSAQDRVRTPIDAFIVAEHERQGLRFAPEADRRTLIRRLSFDLVGLPPSPKEVDRF